MEFHQEVLRNCTLLKIIVQNYFFQAALLYIYIFLIAPTYFGSELWEGFGMKQIQLTNTGFTVISKTNNPKHIYFETVFYQTIWEAFIRL